MEELRALIGRWAPMVGLAITLVSYGVITYLAVLLFSLTFETAPLPQDPSTEDLFFGVFAPYLQYRLERGFIWVGIAASYLFLPGFVSAVIALPLALAWRRPLRVLVLRRFGTRSRSRGLRRTLRQHVAPAGHVYTLADRDIKTPWYIRFPLVFTQLVFLHFRERRVRSRAGIRRVSSALDVGWARNVNWVVSPSKTFPLRASDTVWRDLVQSLTERVDAVLIDVHDGSPNLEWEIRECVEKDHLGKTLFLTSGDRRDAALSLLGELGLGRVAGEKLVVHDSGKREDEARLRAFLESRTASKARRAGLASQLAAASVMIGPFLWGLLAFGTLNAFIGGDSADANRFDALVARLREDSTRAAAFAELGSAAAIPEARHSSPWIAEFDEAVVPLLRELWQDEPSRRREILAVLREAGSPGGAEIWRRALTDAGPEAGPSLEEVLEGIGAARSTGNVPDLLELFGRGEPATRRQIVRALGEIRDESVVPLLLDEIVLQPEGAQPEELRNEAVSALRKILRPEPPLQALGPFSQPAALIAVLGYPMPDRAPLLTRLMPFIAYAHWQRHNTNFQGAVPTLELYGNVEIVNLLVSYPTVAGYRIFQEFPDIAQRWGGVIEYAERIDVALLEVSGARGIDIRVQEHVAAAHKLGIPRVAALINTEGAPLETGRRAALEGELRDLLSENGFASPDVAVVVGPVPTAEEVFDDDARAGVEELFAAIDAWPTRPPLAERPARFAIGGVFQIPGRGTLVTGFLEQGVLAPGDVLEVVGDTASAQVVLGERLDFLRSDEVVGWWIGEASIERLRAGQVLAQPAHLAAHAKFRASAYVLSEEEGGPRNLVIGTIGGVQDERAAFAPGAVFAFQFRNAFVSPAHLEWSWQADRPPDELRPADFRPARGWVTLEVELESPIPLRRGQRFRLFSDTELVAAGAVTEVID